MVAVFLAAGFLAVVLVALAAGLLAFAAVGLPAVDLANLAKAALRRLTVLAFKRPFLTALSYSD